MDLFGDTAAILNSIVEIAIVDDSLVCVCPLNIP